MYYVYILYSESLSKYYIGSSYDVSQRLDRHNRGHSTYTKKGIPWKLVYTEEYNTRKEGYQREMEIKKKKNTNYIKWLIESSVG
ncbi:MAG: GIY-YIG nuclease family protein [Bacteroidales bacterium]|jgi:putative endonuclease|nr:GIY-YIG nuclease family protein [Bacteroidales bacterium]